MATKRKKRRSKPPSEEAPKKKVVPDEEPSKLARVIGLLTALLLAAASIGFFLFYPETHGPGNGQAIRVTFDGTESPSEVTSTLVSYGIVRDPKLFSMYLRAHGSTVAAGPHLVRDDLSPRELVARLQRHGQTVKVTFPEGWTRFDMAKRLEKLEVCDLRAFLDATTKPALLASLDIEGDSAEGYLFPATYDLPLDSDPDELVRTLVHQLDKRWTTIRNEHEKGFKALEQTLGFTKRQVLTLASMVEKEAAVDDERPIIASVFLNRLRDPSFTPKLLQCDPTAGYGCLVSDAPSCVQYATENKITHEMLQDAKNPYNTYKHEGLPPGPIANPGGKAIEAVLEPTPSKFLYFVAKGGGRHTFSETYAEHQAAIAPPKN